MKNKIDKKFEQQCVDAYFNLCVYVNCGAKQSYKDDMLRGARSLLNEQLKIGFHPNKRQKILIASIDYFEKRYAHASSDGAVCACC